MGRAVASIAKDDPEIKIVAGFDLNTEAAGGFPVFSAPSAFTPPDGRCVVVDFSSPGALDALLAFCLERGAPPVLCSTGYTSEQAAAIGRAAEAMPVFRSGNMSLGINLLVDLVRRAREALGDDFDVEIVERHHRRKVDAPSGTALMLAGAASGGAGGEERHVYDRHGRRSPREACEIGISSVRGGTIVGEHEVIFAGTDEVIEFRHSAASRDVFAAGAVRAAKFIAGINKPGLYDMNSVINSVIK